MIQIQKSTMPSRKPTFCVTPAYRSVLERSGETSDIWLDELRYPQIVDYKI